MKEQFISDKEVIANLQNLRWVRKSNTTYNEEKFNIQLCYNVKQDSVVTIAYKNEKDRDSMYNRIALELTKDAVDAVEQRTTQNVQPPNKLK